MGMYNYKARNVSGQLLQGTIEADHLARTLHTKGLKVALIHGDPERREAIGSLRGSAKMVMLKGNVPYEI